MIDNNSGDISINEVAKILDKSDRQVRRYVKERRLKSKQVRVDGHVKLMFSREDVEEFKLQFTPEGVFAGEAREVVTDAPVAEAVPEAEPVEIVESVAAEDSLAVKYVIDVLREQIAHLNDENKDLHYQLEQRSGQVGFLQGQIDALQTEVKMLAPAAKAEVVTVEKKSWFQRVFHKN